MPELKFTISHVPHLVNESHLLARERARMAVPEPPVYPKKLELLHMPGQAGIPQAVETIKLDLPEHFNCSLLRWQGKYVLASRHGMPIAKVHLSILDENFRPVTTWPLKVPLPRITFGMEDPRLFAWGKRLCVSFTGLETVGMSIQGRQCYAILDDSFRVSRAWQVHGSTLNPWEKNWAFFEQGPSLLAVYSLRPHVVIRVRGGWAQQIATTPSPFPCPESHFRGGAPPVHVGREWFHWFHAVAKVDCVWLYSTGVYTFADASPYEVKRYMPYPAILPDRGDVDLAWTKAVSFPCGAVLENDSWLISYGHQDRECRIARFDRADIDARLVPVPAS